MAPEQPGGRGALRRYGIGLALVVIATGAGLMVPDLPAALAVIFIAAAGVAAMLAGPIIGIVVAAVSVVVAAVLFGLAAPLLLIIALGGVAASFAPRWQRSAPGAQPAPANEPEQRAAAARRSHERQLRVVPYLMYLGLPLLVLVVYTNISDVLIRNFGVPSMLQPLVLLLAIPVARYHNDFQPRSVVFQPLTLLLAAYCLVVLASTNWARDVYLADERLSELVKSLVILVVAASLSASWTALRGALTALVSGAALLSALTAVQAAIGDSSLQFGGLAMVQEGHIFGDVHQIRAAGPLGDPNVFGQILLIALPLAVFLAASSKIRAERWAYSGAAAIIGLATLLTYSRGVMLALAVVAVLVAIALRVRLTPANAFIAAALLLVVLPTDAGRRLLTIQDVLTAEEGLTLDPSIEERRLFAAVALRMFDDHPLLGVGAGNYTSHYWPYAYEIGSAATRYDPLGKREQPHSLYLEIASETGLLGLLAFGGAMVVAFVVMYQARASLMLRGQHANAAIVAGIGIALAGYLVAAIFLHAGLQRYLWLVLGFAVAAIRLETAPPPRAEELRATR